MKKFILPLLLFAFSLSDLAGYCKILDHADNREKEKIEIEGENSITGTKPERSTFVVEAYLYRVSSIVAVELYNIGTATVTIMNSAGEITCSTSANTALPVTLNLQLPGEDSYFIEIASSEYYASGFFTLYFYCFNLAILYCSYILQYK